MREEGEDIKYELAILVELLSLIIIVEIFWIGCTQSMEEVRLLVKLLWEYSYCGSAGELFSFTIFSSLDSTHVIRFAFNCGSTESVLCESQTASNSASNVNMCCFCS